MGFPDCSPPLKNSKSKINERDLMFKNPAQFLENVLESTTLYSHVVMPNYLEEKTKSVLEKYGYVKRNEIYHSIVDEIPDGYAKDVKFVIFIKQRHY